MARSVNGKPGATIAEIIASQRGGPEVLASVLERSVRVVQVGKVTEDLSGAKGDPENDDADDDLVAPV